MSGTPNGTQHGGPRPPRAPSGARRTRDKRRTQIVWVPTYLPDYTERVGANGIAMYLLLARACCYGWEPRWPSLAQLAKMMGVSRSTAERTLRVLRGLGLVETEACYDEQGQHSNYWDLTDPYDIREQLDSPGTPIAGAGNGDGAPPSYLMWGDVTPDGGAPAPMTAPINQDPEGSKSVCEDDTHTPSAARSAQEKSGDVRALAEEWCAILPPGTERWRLAHEAEITWELTELLRQGWTAPELSRSINDPKRDRHEFPRVWAVRHGPEALKEARKAGEAVETRHKRAQTLSEGRKETARQLSVKARWDALTEEQRRVYTESVLAQRPELSNRPGILAMIGMDRMAATEDSAAEDSAAANGSSAPDQSNGTRAE